MMADDADPRDDGLPVAEQAPEVVPLAGIRAPREDKPDFPVIAVVDAGWRS
jgi:hypothetical protein